MRVTQDTPTTTAEINPEQVFLLRMRASADLRDEALLPRGAARRVAVWNDVVATAERTQRPVLELLAGLQAQGRVVAVRSIPVANAIAVTARLGHSQAVFDALRAVEEHCTVLRNRDGVIDAERGASLLEAGARAVAAPAPPASQWNVARVGAPASWDRGITGAGVTVGIVDSGFDIDHEALRSAYRGRGADGSLSHDYNWFDASGRVTGSFAPAPVDAMGHGTHVAGIVAGAAPGHAIGVAPGAKLMGVRMAFRDDIHGTVSALDALQFMLAPTRLDGTNPDPARGADIVNNSWSLAAWEADTAMRTFAALEAAGIVLVSSAGNNGRRGGHVGAPGAYPGYLTVGATDRTDRVTKSSSPGPSPFDPTALLPNIAAPGDTIESAKAGGGYIAQTGTSMAAPHVAGAAALLLQAHPEATPQQIREALFASAIDIDAAGPDLRSGHGRVQVDAALRYLDAHE